LCGYGPHMNGHSTRYRPSKTEGFEADDPSRQTPALPEAEWQSIRHAILAYMRRRGAARDVAEDVAQESLTKLLAYVQRGRPASLYALALKIAANSFVDRVRQESRYEAPVSFEQASEAPLPDAVASDRQQVAILTQALDCMPPLRRKVLVRRRIDNQSHARIAGELGLSVAAVEKHVVRGLCDIRRAMEDGAQSGKPMP